MYVFIESLYVSSQVENDVKKIDLLQLLEKYENTNELALATTAGMGFIVRMWVKQGELHDVFLTYTYESLPGK